MSNVYDRLPIHKYEKLLRQRPFQQQDGVTCQSVIQFTSRINLSYLFSVHYANFDLTWSPHGNVSSVNYK